MDGKERRCGGGTVDVSGMRMSVGRMMAMYKSTGNEGGIWAKCNYKCFLPPAHVSLLRIDHSLCK